MTSISPMPNRSIGRPKKLAVKSRRTIEVAGVPASAATDATSTDTLSGGRASQSNLAQIRARQVDGFLREFESGNLQVQQQVRARRLGDC